MEALQETFDRLDFTNSGFISAEEMQKFCVYDGDEQDVRTPPFFLLFHDDFTLIVCLLVCLFQIDFARFQEIMMENLERDINR